jgi:hypothetical protein
MLVLLNTVAKTDAIIVLELAEVCPLLDAENPATLSAVLENARQYEADSTLLRMILNRLLGLGNFIRPPGRQQPGPCSTPP